MTLLQPERGKPFGKTAFYNRFKAWSEKAGVGNWSPHGGRKGGMRRLAEAGCSAPQLMSISGHRNIREVQTYIEAANREQMAAAGMARLSKHFGNRE